MRAPVLHSLGPEGLPVKFSWRTDLWYFVATLASKHLACSSGRGPLGPRPLPTWFQTGGYLMGRINRWAAHLILVLPSRTSIRTSLLKLEDDKLPQSVTSSIAMFLDLGSQILVLENENDQKAR